MNNKAHKRILSIVAILLMITTNIYAQNVVRYELTVTDTIVNYSGVEKRAIAVNGQIPMPTLTFTEGDIAEIVVHNQLKESTSLHWHGLYVPNKEDGVPYLTQMPIEPNHTFTYRFPITQNGTHWYHSHSGMQEQLGMYGSLILKKRESDPTFRKGIDDLPQVPIILSEWTDIKPENVHRMLHNANDWGGIKKGSVQSYSEAIKAGHFKTKLENEWKRMLAMDVSDVYYDAFLINGLKQSRLSHLKSGDKVRLRIANAGASSYFWLTYAGGKITVVANDGNDVEPIDVDRLIIGVSETYDIIVTIPKEGLAYELLATPEDRTGSASIYLGNGKIQLENRLPKLNYFEGMKMMNNMMNLDGSMDDMGMNMSNQKMDMNTVMYPEITTKKSKHTSHTHKNSENIITLNYGMLKATNPTTLPKNAPVRELRFELTGNMNRYVWSMDNKVLSESDKILIKKGENVRIILYNNSMMRHPMHLHGHDFRLLNGQGDYAPLKNVLDILPMETDTIEFNANLEGDWFFHCHILYHMMSGMNRVFTYQDQAPNPYLPDKKWAYKKLQKESNQFHFMFENDFATNGNDGMMMIQNTRWSIGTEWRLGYHKEHGFEVETHIGRYIGENQFFMPFIGFDWRYRKQDGEVEKNIFGQANTKDQRAVISIGAEYILPWLITLQGEIFQDGKIRFQLKREDIPITPRLRWAFMLNTDKEYMSSFKYIITRNIALSTHYDSDMGVGIGATFTY
ncbi:multicopper oxidase family protein [Riemerella columbina]|uniref:multicopper oxidase family protein n=1 Tax=Riemerella columbina TaxID=103810 RepID=UPI00036355E7|nr:multicopper oxidase domain-containing protein [Riemerella columbina]